MLCLKVKEGRGRFLYFQHQRLTFLPKRIGPHCTDSEAELQNWICWNDRKWTRSMHCLLGGDGRKWFWKLFQINAILLAPSKLRRILILIFLINFKHLYKCLYIHKFYIYIKREREGEFIYQSGSTHMQVHEAQRHCILIAETPLEMLWKLPLLSVNLDKPFSPLLC